MPQQPRFPTSSSSLWHLLLVIQLCALLALGALLVRQTEPVALHDLHLAEGEKLQCVSYAPFHLPGQTPFDPNLRISREQIAADLAALAPLTRCVRLYAVDQGLDQVPEVARELGLTVLLGAWIGPDPKRNAVQLDHAIELANRNTDVVSLLIVGNEVLLRRERTPAQMRELLDYARARSQVPITYADVWEFWIKNASLAEAVDRVTVHILPFWEDNPVGIAHAVDHVAEVLAEVREAFAKPVMIGETGWPSAGRQREASQPSRVNQARYVREFVHRAHAEGWDYNLIEAIDQPWKRRLEGTVGGFWGIVDAELAPKFPLAGPLAERDSVRLPALAAVLGALLCLALAAGARVAEARKPERLAALAACGAVAGVVAVLQAEHGMLAYRNAFEWTVLGAVALLALALPLLLARWSPEQGLPAASSAWRGGLGHTPAGALALLRGGLLFAAAVAALLLFADPRYRDFPTLLYLMPALVFGTLGWLAGSRHAVEERICALVLALCVIGRWSSEPANPQAIAWLVTGLLLAAPALRAAREHEQA